MGPLRVDTSCPPWEVQTTGKKGIYTNDEVILVSVNFDVRRPKIKSELL
jgi:hypothetical protein